MSSPLAWVGDEVARLVERCAGAFELVSGGGGEWRLEPRAEHGLAIAVRVGAREVVVVVGPWRYAAPLDEDPEDALDAARLALDLVAAAAFGDLRLREEVHEGEVRAWSLSLHTEAGEQALARGRSGRRRLLRRGVERERGNAIPRPPAYRPTAVVAPAWAPWSGRGGFVRTEPGEAASLAIDGELDLHSFAAKEVAPLLAAYLDEALARGFTEIRVVHGKGKGQLRRTVHALLARHPAVESFRLGSGLREGGWGATMVRLRRPNGGDGNGAGDPPR